MSAEPEPTTLTLNLDMSEWFAGMERVKQAFVNLGHAFARFACDRKTHDGYMRGESRYGKSWWWAAYTPTGEKVAAGMAPTHRAAQRRQGRAIDAHRSGMQP